ncbi:aquaporin [Vairimorpha necatrix]|uniref:Aquaporin n=1 Tax=Vairimorpha necatrix TaxID=6039 RepID=A0AAX4JAT6_9MICR
MVRRVIKQLQANIGEMFASFIFGFAVFTSIIASTQTGQAAAPVIVALTVAFSGLAVIYSFCDICLAHFNPAITFAAICLGKLGILKGICFIIFQIIGFIIAGLCSVACLPGKYRNKLDIARPKRVSDDVDRGNIFATEIFLTAILVYVAFAVGVNPYSPPKDEQGDQLDPDEQLTEGRKTTAPLAIGFTLGFCALIGLGSSGGAFNPGIVLSPMILSGIWDNWYIYLLAQFAGGILGGSLQSLILYKLF